MEAALNGPLGRTTLGPSNLTIGRVAGNQLVVNDVKASSRHAEIRPSDQGYSISDLGSTNGTYVNEQRLAANVPQVLNAGDRIRIGDTTFTYEASGTQLASTVYDGGPSKDAYLPTVAVPSPYETPGFQQNTPYSDYNQAPPPAYAPPPQNYPQQPYSQYAPPPMPQQGYVPPAPVVGIGEAPVKRKSRRNLWILLGIIGGVLLLSCIGCSVLVYAQRSTPSKTLDAFCNAIKSKDYHTAYTQLSNARRQRITETEFTNFFGNPQVGFNSCSYGSVNESDPNAKTNMTFTSNTNGQAVNAPSDLVQDSANNNDWKISDINFPTTTGQ